ncbi:MAG: putative photosynthetic complex assembly protein PuhE [Pseudomonadota bacterium]
MKTLVPILFVVFTWWFSTGVVLWLATRTGGNRQYRLMAMLAIGGLGLIGIWASAYPALFPSVPAWSLPYLGFSAALAVWAPIEFTFLTGILTGPRLLRCPPGSTEVERFGYAFKALSHHEYALAGALGLIAVITLPNGSFAAFAVFLLLWLMRLSAKFTLFSGAPKFAQEMMPQQIAHLQSYIRHDRIGPFFWIAMPILTLTFIAAVFSIAMGSVTPEFRTLSIMLTTLVGLGALEHWFMILPVTDSALWRWALPGTQKQTARAVGSRPRATITTQRRPNHSNQQTRLRVAPGYQRAQQPRRGAAT